MDSSESYLKGYNAYQKGEFTTALAEFTDFLKSSPGHPTALFYQGCCFLQNDNFTAARDIFLNLAKDHPENKAFLNALGLSYKALGRPGDALLSFETCVRLDPRYFEGRYNLALLQKEMGQLGKSLENLEECLGLAPDNPVIKKDLALVRLLSGQIERALADYLEYATLVPTDPENPYALYLLFYKMKNFKEAIPRLRQFIDSPQAQPRNHEELVQILLEAGDQEGAFTALKKFFSLGSASREQFNNLLGRAEKHQCFEFIAQASRFLIENHFFNFTTYLLLFQNALRGASLQVGILDFYQKCEEYLQNPLDPDERQRAFILYYLKGQFFEKSHLSEQAKAAYKTAMAGDLDFPLALVSLGWLHLFDNQISEAKEVFQRLKVALANPEGHFHPYFSRAFGLYACHRLMGDKGGAEPFWEEAKTIAQPLKLLYHEDIQLDLKLSAPPPLPPKVEEALALYPEDYQLFFNSALLAIFRGWEQKAEEYIRRSAELNKTGMLTLLAELKQKNLTLYRKLTPALERLIPAKN